MAVIEVTRSALSSPELAADKPDVDVRLDVHDASRLEWSVSIPMPESGRATYGIDVEMEIPANVFATHFPWDQLQSWTRLDGSGPAPGRSGTPSVDALRRGAVAFAHKLSRASEGFARHCRLAGAVSATAFTPESLEEGLELWLAFAVATAAEARKLFATPAPRDALEIGRERNLVDEYVSVRLLEMLASAERSIAALRDSRGPNLPRYDEPLARIEGKLAEALETEVAHRDDERWLHPEPSAPSSLEAYIERASRLKKHFQEVLFLEPETYKVAERLHNWVAAFVALVASTWAFIWQITLMNHKPTQSSTLGSGLLMLAMVAGAVYAVKDRIKEIGRAWISGNVHRFYAQRVATWRAPAKRLPRRDVVVRAKESFDQCVVRRPDPLSPDSGATMPATQVHYRHRGTVHAKQELMASGVRRVKHIFRYDLSPLFARLDDPVKLVPVLDGATRRVTFTAAPRCYRVAVRLRVTCGSLVREEDATLVLHKRGLDRLEFARGCEAELETGVLPT
ncbi:MAG TPA: hypothetical protein VGL81_33530 [Polyangiaceae bacterium]|jgi:hypothetical protein